MQPTQTPDPNASWPVRRLVLVLRAGSVLMLCAIPPIFFPMSWMAAIHGRLGLGEFPSGPLVEYLARSASALYAVYGALLWMVSTDTRRFGPLLSFGIRCGVVFGFAMLGIDIKSGMPAHWTLSEGPFIIVFSLLLLFLKKKADAAQVP
jgi:hypothetical protein